MNVEKIRLVETPHLTRYLCDDGQVVEVECHNDQAGRLAALAYFEANTQRAKPTEKSKIWVKVEGSALLRRATATVPVPETPTKKGKAT